MSTASQSRRSADLAGALERGEVMHYPVAPFALPEGDDLTFLLAQQSLRSHRTIRHRPATGATRGHLSDGSATQQSRLSGLLSQFSATVTEWLHATLPAYRQGLHVDRVEFAPFEEATRRARLTARNDLLHIDPCSHRPIPEARYLCVFANLHPTEPRVWITADPFAELLRRYGKQVGLPRDYRPNLLEMLRSRLRQWYRPERVPSTPGEAFMQRLHDYMKTNVTLQTQCAKTVWHFQPRSVWLAMTDACSHAVLRGQYGLEHSFFVAPMVLTQPEIAPLALLAQAEAAGAGPHRLAA